jgi:lysophospholipase L1-like esterase
VSTETQATTERHTTRMPEQNRFCRAAAWIRTEKRVLPIFPVIALKYFLLALLAILIVVAVTEVSLRYLATQRAVISHDWSMENTNINVMNQEKLRRVTQTDPIWRSDGIPFSMEKKEKTRILVIGDSFVWGDGYSNANDIWWRQLSRELRQRGYQSTEVLAAGLNGASTQDQLRWLKSTNLLKEANPDLAILGYVTNDPDVADQNGVHLVKQVGRDVQPPRWRGLEATIGRFAPTLVAQLTPRLTKKWASRLKDAYSYGDWELQLLETPNIEAYAAVVNELSTIAEARGLPLLVVTLPNKPDRSWFEPRYRKIEPLYQAANLPFYDILDDFILEYRSSNEGRFGNQLHWGINPANGHPGTVATSFYARKVADILERDYPNAIGPRSASPAAVAPSINDWMPPSAHVKQLSPNEWQFYPTSPGQLSPYLPLKQPYVILSFDTPVSIKSIRLVGEELKSSELWFTSDDPVAGAELDDITGLGARNGPNSEWTVSETPGSGNVNTLKITTELKPRSPDQRIQVNLTNVRRWGGVAYYVSVEDLRHEADNSDNPARSPWVLLEDGEPLAPPHTMHSEIEAEGKGRWSHWNDIVVFSASDNTDPRANGRSYELVKYRNGKRPLHLHIQFDTAHGSKS